MKKLIWAILIIVVISAVVYAATSTSDESELQKITISQAFENFLYAPLYIADEQGFFEEEGLDAKIVTAGGDEKAVASLISGDAQFAVGDPTFVAISGQQGEPGRVIAALLNGVPFWGITKNSEVTAVDSPSGLNGYSVATFPAPSTAYALQTKMFESGNLQPNVREVAFGGLIPAMENGAVDIALELEPNVSTAVKNGARIVYALSDYYPEFAITGVTALPQYIENNPEIVQAMLNAIKKADEFIQENPEEAARIVAAMFPDIPQDVAINAMKNVVDAKVIPDSLVVTKTGWDIATQLRKDVGDITGEASYEEFVVTTFAEETN